jgi:hypothetical protein
MMMSGRVELKVNGTVGWVEGRYEAEGEGVVVFLFLIV